MNQQLTRSRPRSIPTPARVTTISQTPILESSNPMDKAHAIPTEAREQKIVGLTGEK